MDGQLVTSSSASASDDQATTMKPMLLIDTAVVVVHGQDVIKQGSPFGEEAFPAEAEQAEDTEDGVDSAPSSDTIIATPTTSPSIQQTGSSDLPEKPFAAPSESVPASDTPSTAVLSAPSQPVLPKLAIPTTTSSPSRSNLPKQSSPVVRHRKSFINFFSRSASSPNDGNPSKSLPSSSAKGPISEEMPLPKRGRAKGSADGLLFDGPPTFSRPMRVMSNRSEYSYRSEGSGGMSGSVDGRPGGPGFASMGMARSRTESPYSEGRDRRPQESSHRQSGEGPTSPVSASDAAYDLLSPLSGNFYIPESPSTTSSPIDPITPIDPSDPIPHPTVETATTPFVSGQIPHTRSSISTGPIISKPKPKKGLGNFLKKTFGGGAAGGAKPTTVESNVPSASPPVKHRTASPARVPESSNAAAIPIPNMQRQSSAQSQSQSQRDRLWEESTAKKAVGQSVEEAFVPHEMEGVVFRKNTFTMQVPTTSASPPRPAQMASPTTANIPLGPIVSMERHVQQATSAIDIAAPTKRPEDIPLPLSPDLSAVPESTEWTEFKATLTGASIGTPQVVVVQAPKSLPKAQVDKTRKIFDLSESDEEGEDSDTTESEERTSGEGPSPGPLTVRNQDAPAPVHEGTGVPIIMRNGQVNGTQPGVFGQSPPSKTLAPPQPQSAQPPLTEAARYARQVETSRTSFKPTQPMERKGSGGPPPSMGNARLRASSAGGLQRRGSKFRQSVYGIADTLAGRPAAAEATPVPRRMSISPTMHTIGSISRETSQIMDADEKQRAEDMFLM